MLLTLRSCYAKHREYFLVKANTVSPVSVEFRQYRGAGDCKKTLNDEKPAWALKVLLATTAKLWTVPIQQHLGFDSTA